MVFVNRPSPIQEVDRKELAMTMENKGQQPQVLVDLKLLKSYFVDKPLQLTIKFTNGINLSQQYTYHDGYFIASGSVYCTINNV